VALDGQCHALHNSTQHVHETLHKELLGFIIIALMSRAISPNEKARRILKAKK